MNLMTASNLSVAHLRRTLTPGTKLRIVNHFYPNLCRDTVVTPLTNTVELVTYGISMYSPEICQFHTRWPKRADLREGGDAQEFHIDLDGTPLITLRVMPEDTPDWPTTCRPIPSNPQH